MEINQSNDLFILAVEDDALYAEGLTVTLEELGYHNFTIVDNAIDALKIFKTTPPDLMLMDIEINGPLNGIEFVEIAFSIRKTPVIFLTAFSDSVTFQKAKATMPCAYLIKPYEKENLQRAMELALFQRIQEEGVANSDQPSPYSVDEANNAFFVKYNSRFLKVPISSILYVEVEEKFCFFYTKERRYSVNIRLKTLLSQLPSHSFIQTHRSFIVRLDAIEEINVEESDIKINGKSIPLGKKFKEILFSRLKMI